MTANRPRRLKIRQGHVMILRLIKEGKKQREIAKMMEKKEQSIRERLLVLEKYGYSRREGKRPHVMLSLAEKGVGVIEGADAGPEPFRRMPNRIITKNEVFNAYMRVINFSPPAQNPDFFIKVGMELVRTNSVNRAVLTNLKSTAKEQKRALKEKARLKKEFLSLKARYIEQGGSWIAPDPE